MSDLYGVRLEGNIYSQKYIADTSYFIPEKFKIE